MVLQRRTNYFWTVFAPISLEIDNEKLKTDLQEVANSELVSESKEESSISISEKLEQFSKSSLETYEINNPDKTSNNLVTFTLIQ